jgi:hypothetical protein
MERQAALDQFAASTSPTASSAKPMVSGRSATATAYYLCAYYPQETLLALSGSVEPSGGASRTRTELVRQTISDLRLSERQTEWCWIRARIRLGDHQQQSSTGVLALANARRSFLSRSPRSLIGFHQYARLAFLQHAARVRTDGRRGRGVGLGECGSTPSLPPTPPHTLKPID